MVPLSIGSASEAASDVVLPLAGGLPPITPDPSDANHLLRMGQELLRLGQEEAADNALRLALAQNPELIEARRLRRRLASRDVGASLDKMEILRARFGADTKIKHSCQITSGNGANTDYVAQHFLETSAGEVTVFEKCYMLKDGRLPREVLVYQESAKLPAGTHFRFPECYGVFREPDRASVFSELVATNPAPISSRISCLMRARALGELAGADLRNPTECDFFGIHVRKHRVDTSRLRWLKDVVTPREYRRLRNLFHDLGARLSAAQTAFGVRRCLNKGDAQGANLLRCTDGKIVMIDIGAMCTDFVGADLASLLLTFFATSPARLLDDRLDQVGVDAFMKGGQLAQIGVSRAQVEIGMLSQMYFLAFMRILRKVHNLKTKDHPTFPELAQSGAANLDLILGFIDSSLTAIERR